jgi:MFS family permease
MGDASTAEGFELRPSKTRDGRSVAHFRLPTALSPLRHRDFAIYWAGQLFANVGRQFETTVTMWLVYELSGSPLMLGAAGLGRGGAVIVLTLFAGALIDRIGSRSVLIWAQSVYAVISLLVAGLVAAGLIQPWHLVVTSTINGIVLAFDAPARQSMYAWLVPREELPAAVPLNNSVRQLGLVAGPSLAGILISFFGPLPIYLANGVTFAGLLVSVLIIRAREPLAAKAGSLVQHTLGGMTYVFRSPLLGGLMVLLMLFSTFSHGPAMFTIFARDVLQAGPAGLGALAGAAGAGAVVGSILLVTFSTYIRRQGVVLLLAGLAYSAILLCFGLSSWMPLSVVLGIGLGMGQAISSVMANTVVQLAAPEDMRGRVIAFHVLVTRGFDAFSAVQIGVLTGLVGAGPAVVTGALLLALSVVTLGAAVPTLRSFSPATRPTAAGAP